MTTTATSTHQSTATPLATDNMPVLYPWQAERVRDDVIKTFNLRLPEPWLIKLQYLSEKTHKSQQELIREKLLPGIEEEINRLIGQA